MSVSLTGWASLHVHLFILLMSLIFICTDRCSTGGNLPPNSVILAICLQHSVEMQWTKLCFSLASHHGTWQGLLGGIYNICFFVIIKKLDLFHHEEMPWFLSPLLNNVSYSKAFCESFVVSVCVCVQRVPLQRVEARQISRFSDKPVNNVRKWVGTGLPLQGVFFALKLRACWIRVSSAWFMFKMGRSMRLCCSRSGNILCGFFSSLFFFLSKTSLRCELPAVWFTLAENHFLMLF